MVIVRALSDGYYLARSALCVSSALPAPSRCPPSPFARALTPPLATLQSSFSLAAVATPAYLASLLKGEFRSVLMEAAVRAHFEKTRARHVRRS